jgi:transposase
MKKYLVKLKKSERLELKELISSGRDLATKLTRARILLKADQSRGAKWLKDAEIAQAVEVSVRTVERVRWLFVEEGFEAALNYRKPKSRPLSRKIDGEIEAHLVRLACSSAPEGRQRWTLELLANGLVELKFFDSISRESVRQALKKMNLSLG